ncbi:MAG: RNA methyltransferase [Bacteroidetes bacterium]|nr:RNA methyltransferase [Bacteroidota bacterium]
MLSKAQIQLIQSLKQKKFREVHRLFIVEGIKNVIELFGSNLRIKHVIVHNSEVEHFQTLCPIGIECVAIDQKTMERISSLVTPQPVMAVVEIPEIQELKNFEGCNLLLDEIKDPGNMGTIIRIADWYGLKQIICSETSVDIYNPKTVQAAMGSLFRVQVLYTNLSALIEEHPLPVYGALMQGENIHQIIFPEKFYMMVGNEANGISGELVTSINHPITIPRIGQAESLNVGVATAIVLDNIYRSSK